MQLPIGAQWEGAAKNSSLFPSSPGTVWGHPPSPPWLLSPDLPPELVDKWSEHEVTLNFAEKELDLGADMVVKLEEALGVKIFLDWEVFQARPCLLLFL